MLKNKNILQLWTRSFVACAVMVGVSLTGCTPLTPNIAQRAAQPKTPAARNFTSFSASLRCMDDLLLAAKQTRTLISSTGIPDRTSKLNVGADDMLLNAINQMNRKSRTYVFVDQSLERDSGQIAIYTPKDTAISPKLYVRGAITQIDSDVASSKITINADDEGGTSLSRTGEKSIGRGMTIVTVDMHLVSFPDKTVIPGSSVANSMVVTTRGFSAGATGLINVTALDANLTINRVESLGQAVRNLVELGAIELIGRHANVAYWECLNIPAVKQRQSNRKEIVFSSADKPLRIPEVQRMLQTLGYFSGKVTGIVDQHTRDSISHFQASHGLIATGDLNYDTFQHLLEKTKGYAPRRRTALPANSAQKGIKQITFETLHSNEDVALDQADEGAKKPTSTHLQRPRRSLLGAFLSKSNRPIKEIAITSHRDNYRVGDNWQTSLIAPSAGFLSCFHQSKNDSITQVFPIQPDATFQVVKGQQILVPDPRDGFDIKFERSGLPEKIMCILELSQQPAGVTGIRAKQALGPMNVLDFEHLINIYRAANPSMIWGQVSEKGQR